MTTLRIMPREMRLMSERILSLTALPKGFFTAVIDHVMYSQKLAFGGFAMLETRFDVLAKADPAKIAIASETAGTLELDAAGEHAWFVVPTLLDLAGEFVARFGEARITVANALDPAELKIAQALAGRTGLALTVREGDAPVFTATAQPLTGIVAQDDPTLWALLCDGVQIDAELWWRTYHHAKKALAADTVVSRRHAGPMIVNEDGTVIGRKDNDDETDISFLAAPGAQNTQGENAKP
ncbi:hypothetical protein [Mesorhizobium sp. CAU 1732]|uniref:hypothetical protein n=1 Tax=Mesorhizobium sp. CAU 1732 TaxID=3140358 RepID=UPI003260E3E8